VGAVAEGWIVGLFAVAEVDGLGLGRLEVHWPQLHVKHGDAARVVAQGLRLGAAAGAPLVHLALFDLHLEGHLGVHHAGLVLELALVLGPRLVERVDCVLEALVEVQLPFALEQLRRVGVPPALLVSHQRHLRGCGSHLVDALALQAGC